MLLGEEGRARQVFIERSTVKISALLIRIMFISVLGWLAAAAHAEPKYIGSDACARCHLQEGQSWSKRSHAKAFEALKPVKRKVAKKRAGLDPDKDYTRDKECLRCHTTGYRKRGGFKDIDKTPDMRGVGCEACHGAGGKYKVLHDVNPNFTEEEARAVGQLYGAKDSAVCESCHKNKDQRFTEEVDKKYKFDWKGAVKERKSFHDKFEKQHNFKFGF